MTTLDRDSNNVTWHLNKANLTSAVLYAFFGLRLLYIAWRSDSKSSQKKEIEEVCLLWITPASDLHVFCSVFVDVDVTLCF